MIAAWGDNVFVKLPVTTTTGESMAPLAEDLAADGRPAQPDRAR